MSKRSSSEKNDSEDNNKNVKYDTVLQECSDGKISKSFQLNEEQRAIFEYVVKTETFSPIFVSGPVGTGKRTLMKYLTRFLKNDMKKVWLVSRTNIGAREVGGSTIHSAFRFDLKLNTSDPVVEGNPDYLIIHDISAVSAMLLYKMDKHLRSNRKYNDARRNLPFGGVATVAFGDLYNLLLINDEYNDKNAVYYSNVWSFFKLFKLTINMRKSEHEYIEALRMIRVGNEEGVWLIGRFLLRLRSKKDMLKFTCLVSTHKESDDINDYCYQNVLEHHKVLKYKNELELEDIGRPLGNGVFDLLFESKNSEDSKISVLKDNLQNSVNSEECENSHGSEQSEKCENSYESENSDHIKVENPGFIYEGFKEELIFKKGINFCVGTRVMITMNVDGFCNGDIGEVVKIVDHKEFGLSVWVKREYDEKILKLTKKSCYFDTPKVVTKNKKMFNILRKVTGLPMVQAWAVTIHKAQGMTFKNLVVKTSGIWSRAQLYVALSRVAHCDGLKLMHSITFPRQSWPNTQDIEKGYGKLEPLFQAFF